MAAKEINIHVKIDGISGFISTKRERQKFEILDIVSTDDEEYGQETKDAIRLKAASDKAFIKNMIYGKVDINAGIINTIDFKKDIRVDFNVNDKKAIAYIGIENDHIACNTLYGMGSPSLSTAEVVAARTFLNTSQENLLDLLQNKERVSINVGIEDAVGITVPVEINDGGGSGYKVSARIRDDGDGLICSSVIPMEDDFDKEMMDGLKAKLNKNISEIYKIMDNPGISVEVSQEEMEMGEPFVAQATMGISNTGGYEIQQNDQGDAVRIRVQHGQKEERAIPSPWLEIVEKEDLDNEEENNFVSGFVYKDEFYDLGDFMKIRSSEPSIKSAMPEEITQEEETIGIKRG